jgi:hypothetical protein
VGELRLPSPHSSKETPDHDLMSTLLPPPRPPVRPSFYCYAVVDTRLESPDDTIDVRMTRAECRTLIDARPDADLLRIRRCRATRYES